MLEFATTWASRRPTGDWLLRCGIPLALAWRIRVPTAARQRAMSHLSRREALPWGGLQGHSACWRAIHDRTITRRSGAAPPRRLDARAGPWRAGDGRLAPARDCSDGRPVWLFSCLYGARIALNLPFASSIRYLSPYALSELRLALTYVVLLPLMLLVEAFVGRGWHRTMHATVWVQAAYSAPGVVTVAVTQLRRLFSLRNRTSS